MFKRLIYKQYKHTHSQTHACFSLPFYFINVIKRKPSNSLSSMFISKCQIIKKKNDKSKLYY